MSGNSRSPRGLRRGLRDSKLLLVKRKRPPETNHWVPGGKVDWLEPVVAAGKGSHETLRWREVDSNFRFRARLHYGRGRVSRFTWAV